VSAGISPANRVAREAVKTPGLQQPTKGVLENQDLNFLCKAIFLEVLYSLEEKTNL